MMTAESNGGRGSTSAEKKKNEVNFMKTWLLRKVLILLRLQLILALIWDLTRGVKANS